jgi:glycerol-3-phosphate O-acyltransferase
MTTGQSRLQWFSWLRSFLDGWVRAKIVPAENIFSDLGIDSSKPICYVLKSNSIFDFLVLDIFCAKNNLPRPLAGVDDLGDNKDASSIYLSQVGVLRTYGAYRHEPPSPFFKLLRRAGQNDSFDVQLVPVSVFWGRDPGRGEPSIFKLFFPDDDRASFIQKLFIVLAQGKNVAVHYSRPIHLREQISLSKSVEQTARKLTRVIRVHFQTLRNAFLGPGLVSRTRVIETLIRGKILRSAIEDECRKKNITRERAERLAKEYISEIAAEVSPEVIAGMAILLRRLWNRIYSGVVVENIDRLRAIPANAEIVYVPCHRSHMDYLLLNYVLYDNHVLTPHVAAGINLNFWPVGSLIRRVGAFYIRRSFNNNRLYAVAFSEYVSFLLQRGFPVQFFIEGGRSRTGKVLAPKTGMVSMVVSSFLRNNDRPIYFVPVYIAYDRVAEVKTYRKELTGAKKKSESVGQLVQGRKALRSSHGKAYIAFAEPIKLGSFLDEEKPGWRDQSYDNDAKPVWMNPVVQSLAAKIMTSVNESTVCGSVALVATILLATRQRALPEDELLAHIDMFQNIAKMAPYSADARLPNLPAATILEMAERVGRLSRFTHPGGDVIHAVEPQASFITYYRNNVAHLFAVPSAIAFFLQHNDSIREDLIRQGMRVIYPVIKKEFFLRWDVKDIDSVTTQYIGILCDLGLFARSEGGKLTRPEMTSFEFNILRTIGLVIGPALERFAIATHLLKQYDDGLEFKIEDFQRRCVMMAQRISLLTGATDAELPTPQLFSVIFDQLNENGMIKKMTSDTWTLAPAFTEILGLTAVLLSVDMRHSMARAKG